MISNPLGAARRLRAFRLWSLIHTWTSLVSMAFLLLLCLTGLPLIFHHELNHALGYEAAVPDLAPGTPFVPLDRIAAAAIAHKPGEILQFLYFDPDETNTVLAGLSKTLKTAPSDSFVVLDRRTAQVLADDKPGAGLVVG